MTHRITFNHFRTIFLSLQIEMTFRSSALFDRFLSA
jgi:hypothetical protein